MNEQKLLGLNASETPIVECHFFKWLTEHGDEKGFRLVNLISYLKEVGINAPLKSDELRCNLKYVHEHFYWLKFKKAHKTLAIPPSK